MSARDETASLENVQHSDSEDSSLSDDLSESKLKGDASDKDSLTNLLDEDSGVEEGKMKDDWVADKTEASEDENAKGDSLDKTEVKEDDEETKDEWIDLLGSGSLKKKILQEGHPNTRPQRLQKCLISYTCYLQDDSVVESEQCVEVTLGDCEVIQGLDVAIGLMNVGEKCRLMIEPRLAYGSVGLPPKIPKDTIVIYDVELLSVDDDEEAESLTVVQRKLRGGKKREKGNWWYGRGENTLAVQCYRRALDYLDEVEGGIKDMGSDTEVTDSELQDLLEDRISVYNNMAAAQIKLDLHEPALKSLQTVLRCQPNNVKALFRKAKVHRAQNDFPAALKCLQKADQVCPNNPDIQKEILSVTAVIQKQKVTERELARRMFNGPKASPGKEEKKKKGRSNLFLVATLGVAVAVGMVGVAAYKMKFTVL